MKKLSLFAAMAAMLMTFASCEKVEPTALEVEDLQATTLKGYVYYNIIDSDGLEDGTAPVNTGGTVNIEVTELDAAGKATSNVVLVTAKVSNAGKYEASIPVAVGKKAKCKATCVFTAQNNDAQTGSDVNYVSTKVTYKAETEVTISYGETVNGEMIGEKVGSFDAPNFFK